jgi:AmpD protein
MHLLSVDPTSGLLTGARYLASPNADERPAGIVPDLIIVHGISLPPGEFGGAWIDQLFTNCLDSRMHPYFAQICELKVSAHVLIRRDGELVQYVPFQRRAWHAGASTYCGRARCNDFSIGIELEGTDHVAYEDIQYVRLAGTIKALMEAYPSLSEEHIAGHSDVAAGRKTDPGPAFDWRHLRKLLDDDSDRCG